MINEQRARELADKIATRYGCIHDTLTLPDVLNTAFAEVERRTVERAAQVVDQCNREGPYNAIGAASRIRALSAEPAALDPMKNGLPLAVKSTPLRCPFCGGPATVAEYGISQHIVFCAPCDCHLNPEETAADAIASWNRRAMSDDPTKALVMMPWNCPELKDWSIVGMNHYHINGIRYLFVAMTRDDLCIKIESVDDTRTWEDLRRSALRLGDSG
jgi:Lar family restriction alleviation protein